MRSFIACILIILTAGICDAERIWVNSITVNEYNMTWNYDETFTGMDSIIYRMGLDTGVGNNDSYINAWELLNADKAARKNFESSIEKELDVKINNDTAGVEVIEVGSTLSPEILGNIHSIETIVNSYYVNYRFNMSILNAGSIWFLGQSKSPVTIVMPHGIDIVNISGMNNITRNITDLVELKGDFKEITEERGEITLNLMKNASYSVPEIDVPDPTPEKTPEPVIGVLSKIRSITVVVVLAIIILLIYIFKIRPG
jgi:hypothetical protein